MCVLNKEEIEKQGENLIKPCDHKKIKYASYDLSVGEEYRLSSEKEVRRVPKNGVLKIPPYEVCFVLTEETVNLPANICALIFSRHRAAKEGFLMHPQPPVDPGYKGKLYILFHNLSNQSVSLQRGEHLATIVFLKLSSPCAETYGSDKDEDKYMEMTSLETLVGNRTYTPALKKISENVLGWKEDLLSKWIPIMLVIITVLLMIITILFGWKIR